MPWLGSRRLRAACGLCHNRGCVMLWVGSCRLRAACGTSHHRGCTTQTKSSLWDMPPQRVHHTDKKQPVGHATTEGATHRQEAACGTCHHRGRNTQTESSLWETSPQGHTHTHTHTCWMPDILPVEQRKSSSKAPVKYCCVLNESTRHPADDLN